MARTRHYKTTTQRVGNTTYKTVQSRRTIPYGPPAKKKEAMAGLVFVAVIGLAVGLFYLTRSSGPTYTVAQVEQRLSHICTASQTTTLSGTTVPHHATATVACTVKGQVVDVFLFKTNGATTQGQAQMHDSSSARVEGGNWLADIGGGTTDTAYEKATQLAQRVQEVLGGAVQ